MSTLTGRAPKDTYKDLLQVSNANAGVDATLRAIEDGEATATLIKVSTTATQLGSATLVDASENEVIATSSVASAVNHVLITNAATGTSPIIAATGDNTVVGLDYLTKGGGSHVFKVNSATVVSVLSTGLTGTVSGASVTATGSTTARTLASRAADVVNVKDHGALGDGSTSDVAAFNAAYAAVPAAGGCIYLPASTGAYIWDSALSWSGSKPISIIGDGMGVSKIGVTHTGTALTITQSSINAKVTIEGVTFNAGASAGPCARAIDIVFPSSVSHAFITTVIRDVDIVGSTAATTAPYANTWTTGIRLQYAWNSSIENVTFLGRPFGATTWPESGSAGIVLRDYCNDLKIRGYTAYYPEFGILHDAYCEGVTVSDSRMIGVSKGWSVPSSITPVSTLTAIGLWLIESHINAYDECVDFSELKDVYIVGSDFQRYDDNAGTWTGIALSGVSGFRSATNGLNGNSGTGTSYGIDFANGTRGCGDNLVDGWLFQNVTTAARLGADVTRTTITDATSINSNAYDDNFTDSSGQTTNLIQFRYDNKTASIGAQIIAGSTGQTLAQFADVASATAYFDFTASNGSSPIVKVAGSATNIGVSYYAKGGGGHSFYSHAGGATLLSVAPASSSAATNYIEFSPQLTGNNTIIRSAGVDASPSIILAPKGSGTVIVSAPLSVTGNTTLGDAAADTVTINAGTVSAPNIPAVSAYVSASVDNVTGDATQYTVIFDTERFDQGADYNNATGVFTFPNTGKYLVAFSVRLSGFSGTHDRTYAAIVTSNLTYDYDLGGADLQDGGEGRLSIGGTAIVDAEAADTLSIVVQVSGSTKTVQVDGGAAASSYLSIAQIA